MSTLATPTHFIFVDFENVPNVDLDALSGRAVHVTLLIGKNQRKIDLDLALQLRTFASQVTPVQVGASGRNALDLTLACYLGRAIEQHPGARFAIFSKERDLDAMIVHLNANGVKVDRYDSFGEIPLSGSSKSVSLPPRPLVNSKVIAPKASPINASARVMARLKNPTSPNRPGDEAALRKYLRTGLGKAASDTLVKELMAALEKERVVSIDAQGKVTYPPGRADVSKTQSPDPPNLAQ
jgi:hypothetical protein